MKFIVLDVQGFNVPEFTPKELVMYNGHQFGYFLFKPPKSFHSLDVDSAKQVKFLQGIHHCLEYNSGNICLQELPAIIRRHIIDEDVNRVYVKGSIKKKFLQEALRTCNPETPITVIDLENVAECPNLTKDLPLCVNHNIIYKKKCICSMNNCVLLFNWLMGLLPQ